MGDQERQRPPGEGEDTPSDLEPMQDGADHTLPVEPGSLGSDPISRLEKIRAHASDPSRYQMRARVGRGGQGAVYEVWDEDLSRRLAMKIVLGRDDRRPDARPSDTPPADPESLSRFLEEAQVTGQLDHPGVVPIHELGLDPFGHVFFTMRLVHGDNFHSIIRRVHSDAPEDAEWTQVRALNCVLKACEALAYAHAKKVIHRDLKPANLMVGKYGEVYVMDWGLARVLGQADHHDLRLRPDAPQTESLNTDRRKSREERIDSPLETMDGRVVGTPSYMPPEQATGQIRAMGPASDVYSMGAVLYQLITGRMPYVPEKGKISAHTVLAAVVGGPPEPVTSLAPGAPAELVAIQEKAMAREIGARYPDMESLAADLRAYLEGRVVAAYESGAWAELRKWIGRNKGWAATGGVAALFLVVVLAWALFERDRADSAAAEAHRQKTDAVEARGLAELREAEAIDAKKLAQRRELEAIEARDRVLRLSDVKLVADRAAEAKELWPAEPDRIEDLKAWLGRARELYGRLPQHQESLGTIRLDAVPRTDAEREAERRAHEKYPTLVTETGRLAWLRSLAPVANGEAPPPLPDLSGDDLPPDPASLNELAWDAVDPDRTEFGGELRAAAIAERLAALDPAAAEQWLTVAWARFGSGRFEDALAGMQTALERATEEERPFFEQALGRLEGEIAFFRGEGAPDRVARRLREIEGRVSDFEAIVDTRQLWRFPEGETDLEWQHQVLEELVTGLTAFGGDEGVLGDVEDRLAWAEGVTELTLTGAEAAVAWSGAIASIGDRDECPLYDGFELTPQLGLIPLDRNPRTGLWEFWHPQSGTCPEPNPDWDPQTPGKCNRWVITPETGIVFVLIPGGTFRMGAEPPRFGWTTRETADGLRVTAVVAGSLAARAGVVVGDLLRSVNDIATPSPVELSATLPTLRTGTETQFVVERDGGEQSLAVVVEVGVGSPNIDPWAASAESPVHEVTLRPFFLSKYEMTQGQWFRSSAAEKDPSVYPAGKTLGGQPVTGFDPVENVSWTMCREVLENLGLSLPREAQWERGCRAGTGSVFVGGDRVEDLQDTANIADAFAQRIVGTSWPCTMEINDGFVVHAPVGSLIANGFGLHDTLGGVWEWCLDSSVGYGNSILDKDGTRSLDESAPYRVYRGGSFGVPATGARSALRDWNDPALRSNYLGVRPSRVISD